MALRFVVLGDPSDPIELQKLREYLIDLYGYAALKSTEAKIETTDATVTTLITLPLEDNASYQIVAQVVGRRTGGVSGTAGDSASYLRVGTFFRVGAGVATQVGATGAVYTAESQAGWDCTMAVTGSDVLVRMTGAAGNNVTWAGIVTMQRV